jgi:hypothetical protein
MRVSISIVFVLASLVAGSLHAQDDVQYWSQYSFRLWQQPGPGARPALDFYSEGRMTGDATRLSAVFVGFKLAYPIHPNLGLGLAAKRIDLDGVNAPFDGRFELELSPRARISERWRFDSRHRVELFHVEDGSDSVRFRHRLRWTRSLDPAPEDGGGGRWSALFFSNEVFHTDGERVEDVVENRFVPLGGRWRISKRAGLDVFLLVRSRERAMGWEHDGVFGTYLALKP